MMRNLKGKWMNAEAGTEQKMRKGQERDRSGASALDVHPDGHNVKRIGKKQIESFDRNCPGGLYSCIEPGAGGENAFDFRHRK